MATGPQHYREAERLAERADDVMDADYGIYASMGTQERIQRQMAFLTEAQVHATLALAAATADLFALTGQEGRASAQEWQKAVRP